MAQLRNLLNETGLKAFGETVRRHEEHRDVFEHGGQGQPPHDHVQPRAPTSASSARAVQRFKMESKKEWITPFGLAVLARRYFQPERGGEGIVPLDLRCGMVDRPMGPDVEELCAFAAAHFVPREVETLLGKLLPHRPSAPAVQHVIQHVGVFVEDAEADIEAAMRKGHRSVARATSSDRAGTVSLRRCGKTGRRPAGSPAAWRPRGQRGLIVWKEAGVAAISIYGRNAEGRPLRPDMRNFARMPGHGMARLLEQQNAIVEPLLHNRKVREIVFVCDGKKAIWAAAQKMNFHPMALDPRLLPRR